MSFDLSSGSKQTFSKPDALENCQGDRPGEIIEVSSEAASLPKPMCLFCTDDAPLRCTSCTACLCREHARLHVPAFAKASELELAVLDTSGSAAAASAGPAEAAEPAGSATEGGKPKWWEIEKIREIENQKIRALDKLKQGRKLGKSHATF